METKDELRSNKFFWKTLLKTDSHAQLFEFFKRLKEEENKIIDIAVELCWFMRGSVTWNEVWNLDIHSIKRMHKLIKSNVERTNKTGLPLI